MSEFGFQSFPEPRTVRGYTAPDDRNVTAPVMEHHQRSGCGMERLGRHNVQVGQTVTVHVSPKDAMGLTAFRRRLRVRSLRDTYRPTGD